jgi:hypothetical protein
MLSTSDAESRPNGMQSNAARDATLNPLPAVSQEQFLGLLTWRFVFFRGLWQLFE